MKLKKTDRRFNLLKYGFDCYIEFSENDWKNYNRYVQYCMKNFGEEFWVFNERVYRPEGKWRAGLHKSKRWSSKRIYFRGEKYHTLLLMSMPLKDSNTFYL